jgi:hypothetical protein
MQTPLATIYSKSSNVITENISSQHSGSDKLKKHYRNSISSSVSKKHISPRKTRDYSPKKQEKKDQRSKLGIPGVPYKSGPGNHLPKPLMGSKNPLTIQPIKTDSSQASPLMQINPLNLSPLGDKRKVTNFHPLGIIIPRLLNAEPDLRFGQIVDIDDCSPNQTTRISALDSDGRDVVRSARIFAGGKMVDISARPDQCDKRFSKQNTTPGSVGKEKDGTEQSTPKTQTL